MININSNKKILNKKEIIQQSPQPLFSKSRQIGLFWTQKSGCTFAIQWFLFQLGILENYLSNLRDVHKLLPEFYNSTDYKDCFMSNNLNNSIKNDLKLIKFVRNPYSRAVSSYIHVMKHFPLYHGFNQRLYKNLGIENTKPNRSFSFREFINFLNTIDLTKCDWHFRIQKHPSEFQDIVEFNYIVHLENSKEKLGEIENDLCLKKTNFDSMKNISHHTKKKEDIFINNCSDKIFHLAGTKKIILPETRYFYDKQLKDQVAQLYWTDFASYGYDTTDLP